MGDTDAEAAGKKLSAYIAAIPDFVFAPWEEPYGHMGATITDGVLQAGISYETVRSRLKILFAHFPQATTTSAFAELLASTDPEMLFDWQGRKMRWLVIVTSFLQGAGVETEAQLAAWLGAQENRERFLTLPGIGPKTLDYFGILAGRRDRAAIDVRLERFLAECGLPPMSYEESQAVLQVAARELGVETSVLDHSVWSYKSQARA